MARKAQTWIALTVVAALLILVASWFLLVAPKFREAADTLVSIADEEARHDQLTIQLATLEQQFAELDTYKAQLAALQAQIPATDELSTWVRQLHEVADRHGVTIVTVNAGQPITAPAPVVAASAPVEGGDDVTSDPEAAAAAQAEATAAAAAAAASATGRLVGIPVSITVVGTYANAAAFLAGLQTETTRLLLVPGTTLTSQDESPAAAGRPATSPGDVEMGVDGYLYVLPPAATAVVTPPAAEEGTEPVAPPALPSSERNPFAPVG